MDQERLKTVLNDLHFSSVFPPEVVAEFANISSVRSVKDNEALFREGEIHDQLYLVVTGRIALEMFIPGRGTVRILTMGPGEFVGWSGFLQQTAMTATAIADEDTELIRVPTIQLRELCEANPSFGLHLTRRMAQALSRRLVATRLQLLDLFAADPSDPPLRSSEPT